jgi:hypothetical protein
MPLTINVGLSRKASKDYQSSGVSINVTAELDQSLLARPDQLQDEIDRLYDQAEQALARQAGEVRTPGNGSSHRHSARSQRAHGRGTNAGNGATMTQSQRRAIEAISRRLGLDAEAEARDELGLNLDELSVREASRFIDHLKALNSPAAGNGGRR